MEGLLQSEVFTISKVYCTKKYLEYARFTDCSQKYLKYSRFTEVRSI